MDINEISLANHKKYRGKISVIPKFDITSKDDLSWTYTPGVAEVSRYLAKNPEETGKYTFKGNCVAVISDGSAVLGLGNIGPFGAYPVMEGKAMLFKHFANIDAIPIVLNTQDPDEIISTVEHIADSFGGINLEDFAAPNCFYIETELKKRLKIPVVHDDQWGTAVVVLAGIINALSIVNKSKETVKVTISGTGAAGTAIATILTKYGIKNILTVDSKGIISKNRTDLNKYKLMLADMTNPENKDGNLADSLVGSDIFIGVSAPNIISSDMVKTMNDHPVVFALANPVPEIMPDEAKKGGAYIVATGRSDFPNQVNNALIFPGIFRGALDNDIKNITIDMQINAAKALAGMVKNPTPEKIIPSIFDEGVMVTVASCIK